MFLHLAFFISGETADFVSRGWSAAEPTETWNAIADEKDARQKTDLRRVRNTPGLMSSAHPTENTNHLHIDPCAPSRCVFTIEFTSDCDLARIPLAGEDQLSVAAQNG